MRKSVIREAFSLPGALDFPFPDTPAPGTTYEVAPGVLWLRMRLPFALDHINLWLLRDEDGWTAVDTGLANEETRANWDSVLNSDQIRANLHRIIVTHYHPDHIGNAGWITSRLGIDMWTSESEYLSAHANYNDTAGNTSDAVAELYARHGLDPERLMALVDRGNSYRSIISVPPKRYIRILDGDEITIGNHSWQVMTGYGHSPEHSSLYCKTLGVLISGDMLLPKISTNVSVWPFEPLGDPLKLFLRSIDRFRSLPPDTLVLPSHGLPFRGAHTRIQMLHQHHAERLNEIVSACEHPATAAELLPTLFNRKLDTHQLYFAMGEAIAHLNYLLYRKELDCSSSGTSGVLRFVRNNE